MRNLTPYEGFSDAFRVVIGNIIKGGEKTRKSDVYCSNCGEKCYDYIDIIMKECRKCEEFRNFWKYY